MGISVFSMRRDGRLCFFSLVNLQSMYTDLLPFNSTSHLIYLPSHVTKHPFPPSRDTLSIQDE